MRSRAEGHAGVEHDVQSPGWSRLAKGGPDPEAAADGQGLPVFLPTCRPVLFFKDAALKSFGIKTQGHDMIVEIRGAYPGGIEPGHMATQPAFDVDLMRMTQCVKPLAQTGKRLFVHAFGRDAAFQAF